LDPDDLLPASRRRMECSPVSSEATNRALSSIK
jgi:hypothetical protein